MKTILILSGLFIAGGFAKAQVTFHKTYGWLGQEHSNCVRQTTDSGYIVAGFTPGIGNSGSGCYIVKTDQFGDTLWTRIFGGNYIDAASQIQQTADGGYIISGTSSYNITGSSDITLIKTDAGGNIVWNKRYGASMGDYGNSVFQTYDGGYIVAGEANSSSGFYSDICLIKTDLSGNIMWSKITGGAGSDGCRSVIQAIDSGYVITGHTASFGLSGPHVYLSKYNVNGVLQWMKTYVENPTTGIGGYGYGVEQTGDGGYIIVGTRIDNGIPDTWLLKTDGAGNLLWNKTYSGTYKDISRTVDKTSDGGYIIGMSTMNLTAVDFDICIIKTDATGNVMWSRLYGNTADENIYNVRQTNDGGYIIAGEKFSAANDFDFYLIKTDPNGSTGCFENIFFPATANPVVQLTIQSPFDSSGVTATAPTLIVDYGGDVNMLCGTTGIQETENDYSLLLYPNPSPGNFTIQTPDVITEIVISDVFGQIIFHGGARSNKTVIDLSSQPRGVYFCQLISKNYQKRIVRLVLD